MPPSSDPKNPCRHRGLSVGAVMILVAVAALAIGLGPRIERAIALSTLKSHAGRQHGLTPVLREEIEASEEARRLFRRFAPKPEADGLGEAWAWEIFQLPSGRLSLLELGWDEHASGTFVRAHLLSPQGRVLETKGLSLGLCVEERAEAHGESIEISYRPLILRTDASEVNLRDDDPTPTTAWIHFDTPR